MIEVGRVCVKVAGRDAGQTCVVVDVLDKTFVMIDGQTRRRKCNILHLEPLDQMVKLAKNATPKEVKAVLKELGVQVHDRTPKQVVPKPKKQLKKKTPAEEASKAKRSKKKTKKEAEPKSAGGKAAKEQ